MRVFLCLSVCLLYLLLGVCGSLVPRHSSPALEYLLTSTSLNIRIETPPTLIVFDRQASINQVFQQPKIAAMLSSSGCSLHDGSGVVYDMSSPSPLSTLLESHEHGGKNDLAIKCPSLALPFIVFNKPTLTAEHEEALKLKTQQRLNTLTSKQQSLSSPQDTQDYPMNTADIVAITLSGLWDWVKYFFVDHYGALHPFPAWSDSDQTGRFDLSAGLELKSGQQPQATANNIRIAIAADWAAGTIESDFCQRVMTDGYDPHYTLHVGDIYYVGLDSFVESNCLGVPPSGVVHGVTWPHGSMGSFAVEGNHEMYSRAYGFFDTFLPTLGLVDPQTNKTVGQQAGYVSLETQYWRVIMLDTGYNTYSLIPKMDNKNNTQPQAVIDWLINEVKIQDPTDTRGIIFLSHHQVASAFESVYPATATQIADLIPNHRRVLWLFGHEHRLSFYEPQLNVSTGAPLNYYGRCIGNGGFPASISPIPGDAKATGLIAYDDRLYEIESGIFKANVGFNGFVRLDLNDASAELLYSSLGLDGNGNISPDIRVDLVHETFTVDQQGNVNQVEFTILNSNITVVETA